MASSVSGMPATTPSIESVTVPVGMPTAVVDERTRIVNVTGAPAGAGFRDDVTVVVVADVPSPVVEVELVKD